MGWLDNLRKASFRGAPFEVEGAEISAGRRVTLHEYPQRDTPYAEDMGRAAREFSLTAFVIGTGYLDARDQLLAAIETEGVGELIHPYHGTLNVVVTRCRVSESRTEGGMARFDLSFTEAGELSFPAASVATGQNVTAKASKVMSKLSEALATRFSTDSLPNWASQLAGDDVVASVTSARRLVAQADSTGAWLSQFNESTAGLDGQTSTPATLAKSLTTALTMPETVATSPNLGSIGSWAASDTTNLAVTATSPSTDPVSLQVATNQAAVKDAVRGSLLSQGAVAASATPVAVYQDAMALRTTLTKAIDGELGAASSDDLYQAWADLRGAIYDDLTLRARKAARLQTITPPDTTPALALAYDLYEDAGRDAEIVTRNAIRHPGFVPSEPLLVLNA